MNFNSRQFLYSSALVTSFALAGCGGGGGGGGGGATTIAGTATAPGGSIAQFETHKSILAAAFDFVIPMAQAVISGLQPVSTATVELIRIDDDGNQVGDVLATTVTSITGQYSLALPAGVNLSGNLVVRITSASQSLGAMVVNKSVDISPVSQFVLQKFVDDPNLVLADLPLNDVVALEGRVNEFDLSAEADIKTMLDKLEAEAGEYTNNQIQAMSVPADDGTLANAIAGKWQLVDFSVSLHDSDVGGGGTLGMDDFAESLSITAGGGENLSFADDVLLRNVFTNYSTFNNGSSINASIYRETSITGIGDTLPASIDGNGTIYIESPFSEELETVDTQVDTNGPDFGWRYPPSTIVLQPMATGDAYVRQGIEASVRYDTTDTNNDGVKDAIDPNARSGDEVMLALDMVLKQGAGLSVSTLNGNYGAVSFNMTLDTVPSGLFDASVITLSALDGTMTLGANGQDLVEIGRTYNGGSSTNVTLTKSQTSEPPSTVTFPYTVTADGKVTLDIAGDGSEVKEGYSNADGSLLALLGGQASGSPSLNLVNHEAIYAVRLGAAQSLDTVLGKSYSLHPLVLGLMPSGGMEMTTLINGRLDFSGTTNTATASGTARGFSRANDLGQVEPQTPHDFTGPAFNVDSVSANGLIMMSRTNGNATEKLTGFVSVDGKTLVLRYAMSDSVAGDESVGIMIGSEI